jgi:hypothetical protein
MFARAGLDLAEAACERVLHGDTLSDAARRTCLANGLTTSRASDLAD